MEIQGTHQFNAPLASVWEALLDPTVLSKALPGGDQLERVGENDYKAAMNVRVGPVQGRFEGKVTLSDIKVHEGYHMKVGGTGAPGFVNGEGTLALTANADGTLLTYAGDVQVGGRIAGVGQRLIESTAKSIIRQGLKTLDGQLLSDDGANVAPSQIARPPSTPQSRAPSTPPPPTTAGAPAPDFARMAVDVAKEIAHDLASDYVPREKQPQLFAFIAGAFAMLGFVILVRLVQRD